ncbi:3-phosphoshikimate 1-carboxyvinyltransferase [Methylotenera sp.]|uniref:3-phosphoshikimate 1-carboxyvinyltransferase n=1 Tax=Methylotenera sp. TaxID=2051956 RepID=UPI002489D477|nr:3-phosphoshikimate 1-carboxyvinyltransferase [Methylotenera sp.]MDI1362326.1 3-phosphoshikimate 1-carboxyvinyltransferase [Methylotenera sp.]
MEQITLPASHQAQGTMTLPGSKSISNRTLLLAALAENDTDIYELLVSDDTERMLDALRILGIVTEKSHTHIHVKGCNGNFPNKNADLFLGNAGTAFRPLTAALALSKGHYHLHGVPRMHERPIGDLVDALIQIGADIEYLGNQGFPPLRISPCIPDVSKPIKIRGNVSSQFLTAMLMALPLTGKESTVEVVGDLISKPYIDITLNLMRKFNVEVKCDSYQRFIVPANSRYYSPKDVFVEGDASSASYFLAAGAIAAKNGSSVTIYGVDLDSIQGDIKFVYEIEKMGAILNKQVAEIGHISISAPTKLKAIDLDCNHIPDAAMTLAILALFADGTTTLRNIASWRVKETDRIAAMATELRKVGAIVEEGADYIKITPPAQLTPNAVIDTYDDHRMAMCFSLVSLGGVPITINDPKCVNKTFPDYFAQFASIVK